MPTFRPAALAFFRVNSKETNAIMLLIGMQKNQVEGPTVHWRDNQKARDRNEGVPECLLQGNGREVGRGGTCLGAPPPPPPPEWEGTRVIDRAGRSKELQLKQALHILPATWQLVNWDIGLEVPGCWLATLKRRRSIADCSQSQAHDS